MKINRLATVLVCLFLAVPNTAIEIKQSKIFVELWCGGDDNLTQGMCRAMEHEFASSGDFVVLADESTNERQVKLIVTIPTNVDWRERGARTRVFYTVEFKSSTDRKLAKKKGACWENELKTCASQIVRQARKAARKLTDQD